MKKVLLLLLLCLLGSFYSYAQPLHGLDPTFANNGIYVGDTGVYGHIGVQADGKIIVTGREKRNGVNENVKRLNQDGTVDLSFANNGFFTMSFPNGKLGGFNAIAFQADGKIILAGGDTGVTRADFLLARLQPDGSYDSSFGGGGYVITSLGIDDYITSLALQPDGNIVAFGEKYYENELVAVRYNANGMIDSSFGNNGVVSFGISSGFDYPTANDIAVMPDGRILVGADANMDALNGATAFMAIRLFPDGNLDTSFNHTGIAYTNDHMLGLPYCKAMRLQPDGKVLLTGYADSVVTIRFDTTGQLDNSFGKGGVAKIAPGDGVTMELQPDGKILVAGRAHAGAPNTPGVVMYRLLANGSLDLSFGVNGEIYDATYLHSYNGLVLQSDNKILVCGGSQYTAHPSYPKAAIARFMPDANTSSVADLFSEDNITLFPNPANDNIYLDNQTTKRLLQITLHSLDGKLLLAQTHPNINRLSTDGIADGMYYLYIRLADHATLVKKIIIQKN